MNAQNIELPFYELPENAESYTAGTVAAKQVEALGFRFYHATDNLSDTDLNYKPNEASRSTLETIQHIYNLSKIVLNATLSKSNIKDNEILDYKQLREKTLFNLKVAAGKLRETDDLSRLKIIFGEKELPFWNNINGPIADAIWHCGQIASYRRSSGNPINKNVNHFTGTVK